MNLDKLIVISTSVVAAFLISMNMTELQTLIWRAQARLIYEARTETWGSPRFFRRASDKQDSKAKAQNIKPSQL